MSDIRITPGGSMEAIGDNGCWQSVPKAAADEIMYLRRRLGGGCDVNGDCSATEFTLWQRICVPRSRRCPRPPPLGSGSRQLWRRRFRSRWIFLREDSMTFLAEACAEQWGGYAVEQIRRTA